MGRRVRYPPLARMEQRYERREEALVPEAKLTQTRTSLLVSP